MLASDQLATTLATARRTARLTTSGHLQLLTFKIDDQDYALNIANVVQVVRMVAVTRAPKAPVFVEGMINLRGRVIPVVSLRRRCGLADRPYDLNTQLLIARADGRVMALMVDVVSEVLTLPADCIEPSDQIGAAMEHLLAVGKLGDRLILILDPGSLLSDDVVADAVSASLN
ncbi:MAG: chemotaxis protein CheW [Chloroflexi bacterium]|nr:chemotaxis protein CheW [Chloroflexota bacterium]